MIELTVLIFIEISRNPFRFSNLSRFDSTTIDRILYNESLNKHENEFLK
ncbi:hypothetical protein LEP1GSC082_4142 [Leptospira kirschneri str. H2]|uniref:Uncharacterized protein n=2 Tax=Leptospira kirschneri TaxID=29507 RepID=A0A0E2B6N0_9LEPT|nr:hypothetical protein LEP1GSC081_2651 [Leptospira kirschneri str. H1]EKO59297.1 hypothetical protein LEP1GSC082_4142 [Leptospira kirschneri str. H2]EMK23547.1 hypothetical protein LEP1GSC008_1117 [Leptospira kirschneri serovar Bulgarica str. Nikolaevo]